MPYIHNIHFVTESIIFVLQISSQHSHSYHAKSITSRRVNRIVLCTNYLFYSHAYHESIKIYIYKYTQTICKNYAENFETIIIDYFRYGNTWTIKQTNRRWNFINQTKTSILRKIPFARKKSKKPKIIHPSI